MGGYQILNFHGISFTPNVTQYVKDAYEKIEGTQKVILVSGLEYNGVEYHDVFVNFISMGGNFIGNAYNMKITIGNSGYGNDPVTITTN